MSNKMARTYLSFTIFLISRIASVVHLPLRNPYWFVAAYRLSENNGLSLSASNFSRHFPITERRQIGQYKTGSDASLSGFFL